MNRGEREEARTRLLDIALRATQLAEQSSTTNLADMIVEVRTLRDQIAMLETSLRAARTPDDTMI